MQPKYWNQLVSSTTNFIVYNEKSIYQLLNKELSDEPFKICKGVLHRHQPEVGTFPMLAATVLELV